MDPVAASILVSTITSLAEHAPEVAMMLTGTETPEQAIERAHAAVGSVRPLGERIGAAADKRRAELEAAPAEALDVISAAQNPLEIAARIKKLPALYQTAIRHALAREDEPTRETKVPR